MGNAMREPKPETLRFRVQRAKDDLHRFVESRRFPTPQGAPVRYTIPNAWLNEARILYACPYNDSQPEWQEFWIRLVYGFLMQYNKLQDEYQQKNEGNTSTGGWKQYNRGTK